MFAPCLGLNGFPVSYLVVFRTRSLGEEVGATRIIGNLECRLAARSEGSIRMRTEVPVVLLTMLTYQVGAQNKVAVTPRSTAVEYPAHKSSNHLSIGVALLMEKQVRRKLPFRIASEYAVVEVGLYPSPDREIVVTRSDFRLALSANGELEQPVDPSTIVQPSRQVGSSLPELRGQAEIVVSTGHRSGRRTSAGVWGELPPRAPPVDPAELARQELIRLGLPEGPSKVPTSGYLFFRVPGSVRKGRHLYLEYQMSGNTIVLSLGLFR